MLLLLGATVLVQTSIACLVIVVFNAFYYWVQVQSSIVCSVVGFLWFQLSCDLHSN